MANLQQIKGVKITGLKQVQTNIKKIAELYPREANKQIYITLLKIISESDKNVNIDEGVLRDSSYVTPLAEIEKTGRGRGGYGANYAAAVHEGSKPHWTPIESLKAWVRRKGIASNEDEINGIAYAIQKKIARDGGKAYKFLEKALLEVLPSIQGDIASELKKLERQVKA